MSHFSVLVIGDDVEKQLAPYHEFECTGDDNEFVQAIDETEDAREQFNRDTETRYRDPEGNLHSPYTPEGNHDSKFWRELTPEEDAKYGKNLFNLQTDDDKLRIDSTDWHDGKGYRKKAFAWPSEGWTEVQVPTSTVRTFAEFCEEYYGHSIVPFGQQPDFAEKHKYGYTLVDCEGNVVSTVDRTNPNRKWDGYTVGGRWNGYFKLKPMAVGVLGKGTSSNVFNPDYEAPTEDRADVLMKGDIDIEGMREEAAQEADTRYSTFETVTQGLPQPLSWERVQEKHRTGGTGQDGEPNVDWKAAREEYHSQPAVKALHANEKTIWFELGEFLCTREEYVQRFRDSALSTFAVVKDGKWYERGSMGWWGMVSDEQDRTAWNQQCSELINGLPDNTILTVVDCHI